AAPTDDGFVQVARRVEVPRPGRVRLLIRMPGVGVAGKVHDPSRAHVGELALNGGAIAEIDSMQLDIALQAPQLRGPGSATAEAVEFNVAAGGERLREVSPDEARRSRDQHACGHSSPAAGQG